jgi:DNA (cytosine-5)-methyltransferase 1
MNEFTFIDLFAGIGGFHQAMTKLGGRCVFASEIDSNAAEVYSMNYGMYPAGDITLVDEQDIPQFDVLCAGFPCQAFSKAGLQKGFSDTRGTLFFEIERILKYHLSRHKSPKIIILENVRNLVSHDHGNTWKTIKISLQNLGYVLPDEPIIVSPHHFGIPQLRERVVIVGVHNTVFKEKSVAIEIDRKQKYLSLANSILEDNVSDKYVISDYENKILLVWDEFMKGIKLRTIGFPIWIDYFDGKINDELPKWKKEFIIKNKLLYIENKVFIDRWLEKHSYLLWAVPTHKKFEWQAGVSIDTLWKGIIQFRPSGIRVKRPTAFPALVAMVHIPVIGWQKRRLTPKEAARLQCFPDSFVLHDQDKLAYRQLGNAVNVDVIYNIVQSFENKYGRIKDLIHLSSH